MLEFVFILFLLHFPLFPRGGLAAQSLLLELSLFPPGGFFRLQKQKANKVKYSVNKRIRDRKRLLEGGKKRQLEAKGARVGAGEGASRLQWVGLGRALRHIFTHKS